MNVPRFCFNQLKVFSLESSSCRRSMKKMYYIAILICSIKLIDCQTWFEVYTPESTALADKGDVVTLECLVNTSGSGVITVDWKKNLSGSEKDIYSIAKIGNTFPGSPKTEYVGKVNHSATSLIFLNVTSDDSGTYICDVNVAGIGIKTSSIYLPVIEILPALVNISVPEGKYQQGQVISIQVQSGFCRPYTNHSCEIQRTNGQREALAVQNQSHFDQSGQNANNTLDPLFGNTVSFLQYSVRENDNQANITCKTQGDCIGQSMVRLNVLGSLTTARTTEVYSTTAPIDENGPLIIIILVILVIVSFIGSCSVCIFVCIKYPDNKASLKRKVDWICIVVVFLCVFLGNISGGFLWRIFDPNQNLGIIVMGIILGDLGFFILGIVVGIIKDCREQKPGSDETCRGILGKLPNIVLSVATFGGVSAGISIAFSCKNGKARRASITPEEMQNSPRRETSANSKDSTASQSEVPLQEATEHIAKEDCGTFPLEKVKKKKKKKKSEEHSKKPYVKKVETPRKLPPLKM